MTLASLFHDAAIAAHCKTFTYIKNDVVSGPVAEKTFESGNYMPFQRHSCPGPDFKAEKGKNAVFSRNYPLEMHFLPFSSILTIRIPQTSFWYTYLSSSRFFP
jgi:hypothetical protein